MFVWQLKAKNTMVADEQKPDSNLAYGAGRSEILPSSKARYANIMHTNPMAQIHRRLAKVREDMSRFRHSGRARRAARIIGIVSFASDIPTAPHTSSIDLPMTRK
mmetsp:Transcript_2344/g.3369  ORF Transcript_2344/g.3369 Transcript_2344/m.3369 type:complete len:105 (+) Transcript_2344:885-1199(+)